MKHSHLQISLLSALALFAAGAFAGCASHDNGGASATSAQAPAATHIIRVGVNGMVCNFCATNLDKTFAKTPGVKKAKVNLAEGVVLLEVSDPSLPDDATIRRTVADAGFSVRSIERDPKSIATP